MEPVADRPFMPGYGVPAEGGDLLPFSYAEQRLTEAVNYWLSTVAPDGAPHLMPVWAVWLDGTAQFSTGSESRKTKNLRADPRCTIAPQCSNDAELVVVEGHARQVRASGLPAFAAAVEAKYSFDMSGMLDQPVFAVVPGKIIALDETFSAHATRWTFPGRSRS
ncbi:MAG: pyridoxamine 5'-phosphate oxidase family protein [Geodermatophilaceae bacterium]